MISLKREVPVKAAGEERDVWSHGQLAYLTHSEGESLSPTGHWLLGYARRRASRGSSSSIAEWSHHLPLRVKVRHFSQGFLDREEEGAVGQIEETDNVDNNKGDKDE